MIIFFSIISIVLLLVIMQRKIFGEWIAPSLLFTLVWGISFAMFHLPLIDYYPLSNEAYWIFGLQIPLWILGSLLVLGVWRMANQHQQIPNQDNFIDIFSSYDMKRWYLGLYFICGVSSFAILLQTITVHRQVGLQAFIYDRSYLHMIMTEFLPGIGHLLTLAMLGVMLAMVHLYITKKLRLAHVWLMGNAFLVTVLGTGRTQMFLTTFFAIGTVMAIMPAIKINGRLIRWLLTGLVLGLGYFVLMAFLYEKQHAYLYQRHIHFPFWLEWLYDPFFYSTGGFGTFDQFMQKPYELALGTFTFDPFVKIMALFDPLIQEPVWLGEFYKIPIDSNVYTYLHPLWLDWGWAGVIGGPLLLSMGSTLAYLLARHKRSLVAGFIYGLSFMSIMISAFVNHFFQLTTWYFLLISLFWAFLCFKSPKIKL